MKNKKPKPIWKTWLIAILYAFLPLFFLSMESNKTWFTQRIIPYWKEIPNQYKNLDIQQRNAQRHGPAFAVFDFLCKNIPKGSRVLLPPQTYYIKTFYSKDNPNQITEVFHYLAETNIFSFHCMDLIPIKLSYSEEEIKKVEYTFVFTPDKQMQIVKIDDENTLNMVKNEFNLPLTYISNPQEAYQFLLTQ